MLTEPQLRAIEMLVTGDYTKTEIAKEVGKSRQTMSSWVNENDEFMAELDRRLSQVKNQAKKDFTSRLPKAIEEYWKICSSCTDVRTKEKALASWIERSLGRIENTLNVNTDNKEDNIDVLSAFEEVNKEENNE